ncbi:hypothetical protein [Flagellimonas sp.]|uniref:hypothetical protein n=1 Tax=Flagellimonas sp. TaxID=2058762 RepID=UPI003BB018F9
MKLTKKNKYLIGGILAMTSVCYFLAVKKTFELKDELAAIKGQKEKQVNINQQLMQLSVKEQRLDQELSSLHLDNTSLQNNLLRVLNAQSESAGIKIMAFDAPHSAPKNTSQIKTQMFTLEGGYNAILKMLYELEKQGSFGRVSHLDLAKEKDIRRKRTYLKATIYLETVK